MKRCIVTSNDFIRLQYGFGEWLQVLGYAPTSAKTLPYQMREFFNYLESKEVYRHENINIDHVNDFFEYLKTRLNTRKGIPLANGHLNKQLQCLRLFTSYLRETKQSSFAIEIKTYQETRNTRQVLTVKEVDLLYNATDDSLYGLRDKAMLSIYYGCGLRSNEGIQMDLSDVLYERKMIYVRKGKNYTERYVPANSKILQDIGNYVNHSRIEFARESTTSDALFLSDQGKRINGLSLLCRLRNLQKRTGDDNFQTKLIGMHSLRHSIATHLLLSGMKLERIAKFLGHKTIESTQIYTHLAHELQAIS